MGNIHAFNVLAMVYGVVLLPLGLISHHSKKTDTTPVPTDDFSQIVDKDNQFLWAIVALGGLSLLLGIIWMFLDTWSYPMFFLMFAIGVACTVLSAMRISHISDLENYDKDSQKNMNWTILGCSVAIVVINAAAIGFNIFGRKENLPGSGYSELISQQIQAMRQTRN